MDSAPLRLVSRPRAGRRFEPTHELALLPAALRAARALPGAHRGLVLADEMTGPIGIPDFTALVGPRDLLEARLVLGVPPLVHRVDAAVVSVAHPSLPRSAEAFARRLSWPVDTVERRLQHLVKAGALLESGASRYVRPAPLRPLGRLYAVEAKLTDWRRALHQARSYSVWADGYVIVMGQIAPGPASKLQEEVERDKGGLVIDGRWRRRPVVHRLAAPHRLWASEHFVAGVASVYHPSAAP